MRKQPSTELVARLVRHEAGFIPLDPDLVMSPPDRSRNKLVTKVRARVSIQLIDAGYSLRGIARRLGIAYTSVCQYEANRERWL